MKKFISLFIAIILIFTSYSVFALDINKAYYEFKTLHPDFVKSLTDSGVPESTLLSFINELYEFILEKDQTNPVTTENFESYAIDAIMTVSGNEAFYSIQDALLILYPNAVKLAITQGVVSNEFKPLVDTVKNILFEDEILTEGNSANSSQTTPSVIPTVSFTDINESHWAYSAVTYLAENFILNGYLDSTFKPENNITRAEFAKIIVSATNTYDYSATSNFSDVSGNDWYYSYVSTAYSLGYITGYPDGSFRPNENITRADICTIVNRVIKARPDGSVSVFSDDSSIPSYSRNAVYALAARGVINGYSDGSFAPVSYATRAQTAKIIYAAFFQN